MLYQDDLGLGALGGQPVAFADFNSDKFTGMLVLSGDQRSLSVHLWKPAEDRFVASTATLTISSDAPNPLIIENVVPGDFNYDGTLDVLVMGREAPQPNNAEGELRMRIYLGDGQDVSSYVQVPSSTAAQPILFDFVGDMRVHMLGYPFDKPQQLSVWKNKAPSPGENITELLPMPAADQFCKISHPHSNAFVDLNGDCLADLFLTCQEQPNGPLTYQIWTNAKQDGFKLARHGRLPDGAGAVSFADVDGNGSMDMVVPACVKAECTLHILYNHQQRLCGFNHKADENCRPLDNLCQADPEFRFDDPTDEKSTAGHTTLHIGKMLNGARLLLRDDEFQGDLPVAVRTGSDLNQDGYPDLLLITENNGQTHVRLLSSAPCTEDISTKDQMEAGRRAFRVLEQGADALNQLVNVRSAAFFDFEEDGTLDILSLSKQPGGSRAGKAARVVVPVQNNYFNDAFFLKTLVLNGVCPGRCSTEAGYARQRPYGVSYYGASFKYTVIDRRGRKHAKEVAQLSQSAYVPLQMPYCLFGLGRTNNYVEELFIGVTRHQASGWQARHYRAWAGVIPNSQLVVVPYQAADVHAPDGWTRELFVNPSAYVPSVLLTLIGASIILAIIVMLLDWREKREDQREKRSISHVLNFDAL
ncbi:hypothetical protein THASP1DRAFT_11906 [Thamnocephalis sphaerospora]|uniref:T-cell immunomodulatory protein TIP C2 domain-containing protein n=1 Tax=Thamnocephalis sphaerospora TaxID=78915 RepID=A0A4V1IXI5_9FUNG|nr:hypothetical protein THASP1DRAFT_11906 [Thamnocephalis sphaerospora]|eukprot:RKP11179.1 hypothetical protein THASP1DRAFT_11906 [Thamnocephalis sphaerospora]